MNRKHQFYCSGKWFPWRWSISTVRSPEGVSIMWQWESESSLGCVIGEAPLMIGSQRRKRDTLPHSRGKRDELILTWLIFPAQRSIYTQCKAPSVYVWERERRGEGEGSVIVLNSRKTWVLTIDSISWNINDKVRNCKI